MSERNPHTQFAEEGTGGEPSAFQQYLAESDDWGKDVSEKRGTYFHNKEKFQKIFAKYGPLIMNGVEQIIWNGQSLDWVNMFHKTFEEGEEVVVDEDEEDQTQADLTQIFDAEHNYAGSWSDEMEESARSYEQLSAQEKHSLMCDIIGELAGHISDYRNGLSPEDRAEAASARTTNYYRDNYADDNLRQRQYYDQKWLEDKVADPATRNPEDYQVDKFELGTYEYVIKQAIRELGRLEPTEATSDFLLSFWHDNPDAYYGPEIAATLSKNNPEQSAGKILNEITTASPEDQNRLLSLLYRLELGRVGISEAGVNYLGRQFDVGLTSGFVSRLTPDGKVGVFDELKRLVGLFQLEADDFTTEDHGAIKKTLESITLEMLFTPVADENPEARREKEALLAEFTAKYFETYIELFSAAEQTSGLRFNNLALPEQGFVLKFLIDHGEGDPERQSFFDFVGKYGEDGLRAFRSLEFDKQAGEKLLDLESRLKSEDIERLLDTYGQTYRFAEATAGWINQVLNSGKTSDQRAALEVNLIREQILRYAQVILFQPEIPAAQASRFQREVLGASVGLIELQMINRDLQQILTLDPTPKNFEATEHLWGEYLCDNQVSNGDELSLSDQVLSEGMQRLYNNPEFSLRDYEGKTTDTTKSLEHLLDAIDDMISQSRTGDMPTKLVYDVGAGDGRMAIPLALAGYKVAGIDNSERMVLDAKSRPLEVRGAILDDQADQLALSTRQAFDRTGKTITQKSLDDLPAKIKIEKGDFFHYGPREYRQDFGERQPDVAIIMWHTLGFAGSKEGMKSVVRNIYDTLRPGGRIIVEMPDRNFGGYARAIREFHDAHPEKPFGVIEDAPSKSGDSPTEQNAQFTTTRYFPSNAEIFEVLEEVGFDRQSTRRESYFVQAGAESSQKLLIKENMFVADKPLDGRRMDLVQGSYPEFGAEAPSKKRTIRHLRDLDRLFKRRVA